MSTEISLTSEDVAEIVAILDATPYERLDVRTSRFSLRVARSGEGWSQEWTWSEEGPHGRTAASSSQPVEHVSEKMEEGVTAIRSPLPGMFYRAPEPGARSFVEVGDRVGPDTVVALVEAMKVMNAVVAGCSGTVEAVLVVNGEQVSAQTTIMRVRGDG